MDWIWLIGLVLVVIAAAITTFYLLGWMTQTRQAFRAAQPDLRITNLLCDEFRGRPYSLS